MHLCSTRMRTWALFHACHFSPRTHSFHAAQHASKWCWRPSYHCTPHCATRCSYAQALLTAAAAAGENTAHTYLGMLASYDWGPERRMDPMKAAHHLLIAGHGGDAAAWRSVVHRVHMTHMLKCTHAA
jgi:hypothetical protein